MTDQAINFSMSVAQPHPPFTDWWQKLSSAIAGIGLFILFIAWFGYDFPNPGFWMVLSILMISVGTIVYGWRAYADKHPGIKNDGVWFSQWTNRGLWAWIAGIVISCFYIALYKFPETLGLSDTGNKGLIALFDPLSMLLKGKAASQWFVYGTLYSLAILLFGIKFYWKYRHNQYQKLRTLSVIFFQLFLAYLIPEIIESLHAETGEKWFDKDLKNMWPLDYDFFYEWHIDNMALGGKIGLTMLVFGLLMIFVISPLLTYKYGKRWYCSWICGCGGLAETAGDPFRQLSDKSLRAWKIERWLIHGILLLSLVMTIAVIYSYLGTDPEKYLLTKNSFSWIIIFLLLFSSGVYLYFQKKQADAQKNVIYIVCGSVFMIALIFLINYLSGSGNAYFINSYTLRDIYGFYIGAIFSGIIGVGFYPILGSRVWCRFGCPMAAILGIQQKLFSKFRITTNGGQCISCGNCSTYCEMGIDVRWYAQRGQNIVRASCVGCGICSAVCPRGVLRLENGSSDIYNKTDELKAVLIKPEEVKLIDS